MKKKLLVSFSGGETSAFMVKWLLENKQDKFEMWFVFANTSKEKDSTLKFAHEIDVKYKLNLHWLEAEFDDKKGIGYNKTNFSCAKRNGEVFEKMIRCYGLPNNEYPHCTRELKMQPIHRFAKEVIGNDYYTAIGIRADEVDRVNSNWKKNKYYYPLVENNITKPDVNAFWRDQAFRLDLKGYQGNCDLCWKKSTRKLITIISEDPNTISWWQKIENKYKNFIPKHRNRKSKRVPIFMYRGGVSCVDLLEMSKQDFEKANNDAINYYRQEKIWGYDLDTPNGCEESCEAF